MRRIAMLTEPRRYRPVPPTSDTAATTVGAALRAQRIERGVSLRELARRLDVSASLVSQIETGKSQPSVRTLYAMVAELGLSLDEMLELAGRRAGPLRMRGGASGAHPDGATIVERAERRRVLAFASGVRWERFAAWGDPDVEFLITTYVVGGSSSADGRLTPYWPMLRNSRSRGFSPGRSRA